MKLKKLIFNPLRETLDILPSASSPDAIFLIKTLFSSCIIDESRIITSDDMMAFADPGNRFHANRNSLYIMDALYVQEEGRKEHCPPMTKDD